MDSFAGLLRERRSVRKFEPRPVEVEKVAAICEAGRRAPSAHNLHPVRVMILSTPEQLVAAAKAQPKFERNGSIYGAPLAFVVCGKEERAWRRKGDGLNQGAETDAAVVCDEMMLQAVELGLGTCWIGAFDPAVAARELDIPAGVRVLSILVAGYPADELRTDEQREAGRIPMAEFLDVRS